MASLSLESIKLKLQNFKISNGIKKEEVFQNSADCLDTQEETIKYLKELSENSSLKSLLDTYDFVKNVSTKLGISQKPVSNNVLGLLEELYGWISEKSRDPSGITEADLEGTNFTPADIQKFCQQLSKYFSDPYVLSLFESHDSIARSILSSAHSNDKGPYDDLELQEGQDRPYDNLNGDDAIDLQPPPPASLFEKQRHQKNSSVELKPTSTTRVNDAKMVQGTSMGTLDTRPTRLIDIKILKGQPLGITITEDEYGNFLVARILQGGAVDKQGGLLRPGDVIKEINGIRVRNMEQVNTCLRNAIQTATANCSRAVAVSTPDTGNDNNTMTSNATLRDSGFLISFRIIPTLLERLNPAPIYLKALFDYEPLKDNLIPSKEAGLRFRDGDILEIVNKEDPMWWQAKRIRSSPNIFPPTTPVVTSYDDPARGIMGGCGPSSSDTLRTSKSVSSVATTTDDYYSTLGGGGDLTSSAMCAKLIPSQTLAESRKAFVRNSVPDLIRDFSDTLLRSAARVPLSANHQLLACGAVVTKKTRKQLYRLENSSDATAAAAYEDCDVRVYQEVSRMPPFSRKCLVLVGCRGIGKAYLKHLLLQDYNYRAVLPETTFGLPIPHTTRARRAGELDGSTYHFVPDRSVMEREIESGHVYLETGELNGNLYGTKFTSIKQVIDQGHMCLITLNDPKRLKYLSNAAFTPFIVFLASPPIDKLRRLWRSIVPITEGNRKEDMTATETESENEETGLTGEDDHKILTGHPKNQAAKLPLTNNVVSSLRGAVIPHRNTAAAAPKQQPHHTKVNKVKKTRGNSDRAGDDNRNGAGGISKLPPALQLSPLRNPRDVDCFEMFEESCSIKRNYNHLFDLSLVNVDLNETYRSIVEALEKLKCQTQWVPTDWVF